MSRRIIWAVGIFVLFAITATIGSFLFARAACRTATKNGAIRDFRQFTAQELETEVRSQVPIESSREFVEAFLVREGMGSSYEPSLSAVVANAPCLKGSGIVIESLGLTFRFDRDSKLKSIEARVHLTGP